MEKHRILWESLACPKTHASLARDGDGLVAPSGTRYPIVRGIPRFVPSDAYVGSFSFEWNTHDRTQLDCHTGSTSSEEIFRLKTGFEPRDLRGKLVLDAGVGAGRFTDVMSRWGAEVIGIDLSYAVEASAVNFADRPNVLVAQADIGAPPFRPATFDAIVSIGVLHHTPDTRRYFEALLPFLKPGGTVAIWVYPKEGDYITRNWWIPFTRRIPPKMFYEWCRWFVPMALRRENSTFTRTVMSMFPFSNQRLGIENDILDTFDGYSPRYHGIHTPDEVKGWFRDNGLVDVETPRGVNTSVRGRRAS
jgi:SAM-dependent methyltransferase